ncbi:hypothetical protein ACP70R_003480 [Stipagrostis hirtigluma subsp. patula]
MASPAQRRSMGVEAASDRDWSELPLDALTSVFAKLGAIEVLMGAGLVCHSWLDAAKVPDLWRSVDMAHHRMVKEMGGRVFFLSLKRRINCDGLCAMAKAAVDRSGGQLEVFMGKHFVTDDLLKYIGHRSPSLKCLGLMSCHGVSNEGFTELISKAPLLEDLQLEQCPNIGGREVFQAAGEECVRLKRFSLRKGWSFSTWPQKGEALGVAAMRELRSLTLAGSNVTNDELAAILAGCPHLELLSVQGCYDVVADDALRAKCARIKTLTLPCYRVRG